MSSAASTGKADVGTAFGKLRLAGDIIRQEAIDAVLRCSGSVIVSGMGKAGLIGQKIVATLASTGTPSHFLHPGEAIHGDLGRIGRNDLVLLLSFSGQTEEVTRLLRPLREMAVTTIAITASQTSQLGHSADITIPLGQVDEACSLGLAPSTSTTMMLALGDALALVVSRAKGFAMIDFARFHPGGSLGRKLAKVEDLMRPLADCRVAVESLSVADVLNVVNRPGRRTGAIMLVNARHELTGIFTDSDLARLVEQKQFDVIDKPIRDVMTREPLNVVAGTPMSAAIDLLADKKISELPVVDRHGQPQGLVDITDVVGL